MRDRDIDAVTKIYLQCFRGMRDRRTAKKWITLKHRSFPACQYFVAVLNRKIVGYIQWAELGGFRKEAVIELEQVAVRPDRQGRGMGGKIVRESLKAMAQHTKSRKSSLKLVKVTTGTANEAQRLYRKELNAKPVAVIPDFFRSDEVIMIARRSDLSHLI
jgi:GNAT superfamily N-acetyltransferase